MDRMAVLDFETANHQAGSACQLGLVIVEPWQIVSEHRWMIRPQRLYFSPRCVQVHGITPRDVVDSPTWDRIWNEVAELLDGTTMVAHNAGFDANVLSSTCRLYDIALPPVDLQCTRLVAKRAWPALRSHSLASVAEHLGIRFRHHDALEDAKASATILIEAATQAAAADLPTLEDHLGVLRGRVWTDRIRQPRSIRRNRADRVTESEPRFEPKRFRSDGAPSQSDRVRQSRMRADEILANCQQTQPLAGKHVVLLHNLLGMDREDSIGFLSQLGATVQPRINMQTHYLVIGMPSQDSHGTWDTEPESRRTEDVAQRQSEGHPIRVLSQRQLLAMIPAGLAIARGDV